MNYYRVTTIEECKQIASIVKFVNAKIKAKTSITQIKKDELKREKLIELKVGSFRFKLEKQLEDFIVFNWERIKLSKKYDIVDNQYMSDTGPIDILAISKDKSEYLVIELKKGKTSDSVVGQILRYMAFIKKEVATANQKVKGLIIAIEDDKGLRNTLELIEDVSFKRYKIYFDIL